jgi:5-methylcytosine-specific restriction endonuclease McrA
MSGQRRYLAVLKQIRRERGCHCEACGAPAKHGHHIIPVSETGIAAELVFEPANIILLCDDCHALMHPLLRNVSEWSRARQERGQAIHRS